MRSSPRAGHCRHGHAHIQDKDPFSQYGHLTFIEPDNNSWDSPSPRTLQGHRRRRAKWSTHRDPRSHRGPGSCTGSQSALEGYPNIKVVDDQPGNWEADGCRTLAGLAERFPEHCRGLLPLGRHGPRAPAPSSTRQASATRSRSSASMVSRMPVSDHQRRHDRLGHQPFRPHTRRLDLGRLSEVSGTDKPCASDAEVRPHRRRPDHARQRARATSGWATTTSISTCASEARIQEGH